MLKYRSTEEEIMDDLNISGEVIDYTLKELNTINKFLGGNQISLELFKKAVKGKSQIHLADLGCGGGDIMMEMAIYCRKKGIKARFTGVDANPHIVSYAEKHTKDFPEIEYQCLNVFDEDFKNMQFDIIHCCLFTHHFTEKQLSAIFEQFKTQSDTVIINDLQRHPVAYWSIKLLTSLFSRSYMVRNDAAVSVSRGFLKSELKSILHQAGIEDYSLQWKWAFRWAVRF